MKRVEYLYWLLYLVFTRESEEASSNKSEPVNKENIEKKEPELQLFKKPTKKRFGVSEDEKQVLAASKASQSPFINCLSCSYIQYSTRMAESPKAYKIMQSLLFREVCYSLARKESCVETTSSTGSFSSSTRTKA
mgnify:CR=1 FL=1